MTPRDAGRSRPLKSRADGFSLLLGATAIGGAAGYLVTWLVPRQIGFAANVAFAVFWAFLFLLVSALSGIQQEVTRATMVVPGGGARHAVVLAGTLAVSVAAVVLATSPLWVHFAFPESGWALVWPLAVGAASYVVVAVVYGSLYGALQWRTLFWLIVVEALTRVVLIALALAFAPRIEMIAWAAVAPIPLAIVVLSPMVKTSIAEGLALDVGIRQLAWNLIRTVAAAASMGALVSGLPFLLGLVGSEESRSSLGLLIAAITLTRAPLIVVAMALQSYLIVLFKGSGDTLVALFFKLVGLLMGVGALLAVAAKFAGPPVFSWLFPDEAAPSGNLMATLVLSSVLVGMLFVSAPAVLARSWHAVYTWGWLTAALVTVACLLLPIDFTQRTLLALLLGPCAGLAVHVGALFMGSQRVRHFPSDASGLAG